MGQGQGQKHLGTVATARRIALTRGIRVGRRHVAAGGCGRGG